MKTFDVVVIKCNSFKFEEDYANYIISSDDDYYYCGYCGYIRYTMEAPQEVYDEIKELSDNCIYIVEGE